MTLPTPVPLGVLLVVLAVLLLPAGAAAQGTYMDPGPVVDPAFATDLRSCLGRQTPPSQFDPDQQLGEPAFQTPRPLLDNALFCADAFAGGTMRAQYGQPLFNALLLILVVWTGIQIMFSGRFDMAELISTILYIGFIAMLLWSFPIPGGGPPAIAPIWGDQSFPLLVSGFVRDLSETMVFGTWVAVTTSFTENVFIWRSESVINEAMDQLCNLAQSRQVEIESMGMVAMSDECQAYLGAREAEGMHLFVFGFFFLIAAVLGVIPVLVALFSMLWGYFSLIVVTLVGPIMIPWGLIPQTSFLMWGWVRGVIAATVQMLVGSVVFVVVGTLLLTPFEKYAASLSALLGAGAALTAGDVFSRGFTMFLEFLPLAVVAILGAFKTGEITNMILSGGGVPSSGLADRMQGARGVSSGVRGAASGVAAVAGTAATAGAVVATGGAALAAAGARQVMSAVTRAGK